MEYLKTTGKMFFKLALFCSVFLGLLGGIKRGEQGIIVGVGIGLVSGFFLTAICIGIDLFFRVIIFLRYGRIGFSAIVEKEIIVNVSNGGITYICKKSLENLNGVSDISDNNSHNIIATCRKSWRSSGEMIEIQIVEKNNRNNILIRSMPIRKTEIFDFGKGIENTEIVSRFITQYLPI